jgi:hypothetical protein
VSHQQVAFRLDTLLEEFVPGTAGPTVSREPERYAVETSHITGHEVCGDRLGSSCPCKVRCVIRPTAGLEGILAPCEEHSDDRKMWVPFVCGIDNCYFQEDGRQSLSTCDRLNQVPDPSARSRRLD